MVLSFAHPDDEAYNTGILCAKYSVSGWHIHLLIATLGQHGTSDGILPDQLGVVRSKELDVSSKILGIEKIHQFGYMDGMLKDVESGELEDKIHKKLLELSPDIVVTFDAKGITNHPDHIKMSFATTYAFQRYSADVADTRNFIRDVNEKRPVKIRHFAAMHKFALKQEQFSDIVETPVEPKLYYATIPQSSLQYMQKINLEEKESFGKPMTGTDDKYITTVIEGSRFMNKKIKALRAHESQISDIDAWIDPKNPLLQKEFFILRMVGRSEVYMGKQDRVSNKL